MDISTSTSLPLNLSKSPAGLGISGSGSFQSHLSVGKSHQRLRAGTHSSPGKDGLYNPSYTSNNANIQNPPSGRLTSTGMSNWVPADIGAEAHTSRILFFWPKSWFQWAFLVYGCLSVVFFTIAIFKHRYLLNSPNVSFSPFADLSNQRRLSIISAIHPQARDFEPMVLDGNVPLNGTTACLWTQDHDLDAFSAWASRWAGPISLLVTTTVIPSSEPHRKLLRKLSNLKAHLPVETTRLLSLHILYITPKSSEAPNAYLNLARLFSRTDHVMLFPGNFSLLPPPTLFDTISSQLHGQSNRLLIISNQNDREFPFPVLAPALMRKDHSVWCTERFFLSRTRDFDWEACLWQLWLDSFGEVKLLQNADWKDGEPIVWPMNSASNKLRQRMSFKYRVETCILASKRLEALSFSDSKGEKGISEAAWLKRACKKIAL